MIAENCVNIIKDSAIAHEVIGKFINLKKKGANYEALCPFHDEKTPSFSVSPAKNMYKCFGCGKAGDSVKFLMEYDHKTYTEALQFIAGMNNIQVEYVGKNKIEKPLPRLEKLSKETIDYFENSRKISNNTLLRFGITESNEWMPKAKSVIKAICFNYMRDGELVNIKFRGKNKDFLMQKNAELIFYNLDSIKDEKVVYITEGEIDCMSLHECGVYNVISVPNGGSVSENSKLEYLDNCWHFFNDKEKYVLVTDSDATGVKLRDELARRFGYELCYTVIYPDGCKDANDVLVKYGKEALLECLNNMKRYPLYGEISMDDMYETVCDFYENGYPKGCAAKISTKFDELLTFYPGQLTIVTGIPGSGKSEFVDWLMTSLAKEHGWTWGISSFECPPEVHVTKLIEKFTNKGFAFKKDNSDRVSPTEFEKAIGMIDKYFHFMNLNIIDVTIDGLISKAEEFVKRYGINGFLFDPWNCIEAKDDSTNYILQCLNKLIGFLDKYKVHGFLVAHPTKLKRDLQTKKYEIPTLYSISGSAHFFNRTHNGFTVYRDFESNLVDVYVQKVKWNWLGKLGKSSFEFDIQRRLYKPIENYEKSF